MAGVRPRGHRLADWKERAQAIQVDAELVVAWHADRATGKVRSVEAMTLVPGERVCFTGAGGDATRPQWQQLARAAGLMPTSKVGADLTVLVCSDGGPGAQKLAAAAALSIPVINYDAFQSLLEGLPASPV